MSSVQSWGDKFSGWLPWSSAEEISPPPPPPSPPPAESLPGVSQWNPWSSVEETPSSFLPESLVGMSEKIQGLIPNVWTSPHFEQFQDFGKKVCEFISPLVSDRAEEICADETNHTIAAVAVAALAGVVLARTALTAARAFSCRNKNLRQCIESGSLYGVKKRLKKADVDSISLSGETALIFASRWGQVGIVKYLLQIANPDSQTVGVRSRNGDTALHAAIRARKNQVVPLLLEKADINKQNGKGQTPLMVAIDVGNDFAVEALAKQPAIDWSAQDLEGNTVFHYAVRKLLDQTILGRFDTGKVNMANKRGELPLHVAVSGKIYSSEIVNAIREKTRDTYATDANGKTPFVRALEVENIWAAEKLFDQERVVTAANSDVVGLALKKGMKASVLLRRLSRAKLQNIKPEGLALPDFAAVYGLDDCLKCIALNRMFFAHRSDVEFKRFFEEVQDRLVKHLLENPSFLKRITHRKYDAATLLKELATPADASAGAAHRSSEQLELLIGDAQHYLRQLGLEYSQRAAGR